MTVFSYGSIKTETWVLCRSITVLRSTPTAFQTEPFAPPHNINMAISTRGVQLHKVSIAPAVPFSIRSMSGTKTTNVTSLPRATAIAFQSSTRQARAPMTLKILSCLNLAGILASLLCLKRRQWAGINLSYRQTSSKKVTGDRCGFWSAISPRHLSKSAMKLTQTCSSRTIL